MAKDYRFLVGGEWVGSPNQSTVTSPWSGDAWASVAQAGPNHIEEALRKAYLGFDKTRRLSSHAKGKILLDIGNRLIQRKADLLDALVNEGGKPLKDAREELSRAVYAFRSASDAVQSMAGTTFPADAVREGEGMLAFSRRFPLGPVLAIGSFAFPLASLAQKLAPAIAAGNPFLVWPAKETPVSALLLGEIVAATEWPREACSILPCSEEHAWSMVEHDGVRLIAYTGKSELGWRIKAASGKKRTLLQMSGIGMAVVNNDADLEYAADCCVAGAFSCAGQIDSSLQRILVHDEVFYQFLGKFIKKTNQLAVGDPADPATAVGPVINDEVAQRIEAWIKEAVNQGADLIAGGSRVRSLIQPTVILETTEDMQINQQQVFGPVVAISPFTDVGQALWTIQDASFGLQASLFTNSLDVAMRAFRFLDVGTILVNELPTFRLETIPFGGTKDSSFGKDSIKESLLLMTDEKVLLVKTRGEDAL